jgi:hypothetical protein
VASQLLIGILRKRMQKMQGYELPLLTPAISVSSEPFRFQLLFDHCVNYLVTIRSHGSRSRLSLVEMWHQAQTHLVDTAHCKLWTL